MAKYPTRLVQSSKIARASLHVCKPVSRRLYVGPFGVGYLLWSLLAIWLTATGRWDDLWFVPVCLIAALNVLAILACNWSVRFNAYVTCREAADIKDAELVLVEPVEHEGKAALVALERDANQELVFHFQQRKFIYDAEVKAFRKPRYPVGLPLREYFGKREGLSAVEAKTAEAYYGPNKFEVAIPSFLELFKEHAVAPFFVFQVFCVGLWCLDEYWYYSVFTLVMLVVFESTVVAQRLKNMTEFRAMSLPNVDMTVHRGGEWTREKTERLFPGDLVFLEMPKDGEELTVPGDLVLLAGSCIINEAMISGESTPMLKESLYETRQEAEEADVLLSLDNDRNHLLFGGTKILQISSPASALFERFGMTSERRGVEGCFALVMRTGFSTLQGRLVRTMMFTSERMTANNMEAFAFILFLLIFALAAAGYVLYWVWEDAQRSRFKLLVECTLIITAVVPPELPMELSLAVNNSLMALGKFAIFCMEPFRIPFAGKLDVCCFDKTGTLTGENLVVKGVVIDGSTAGEDVLADPKRLSRETTLVIATCHALFVVSEGKVVVGDPMEKTALDFVHWTLSSNDQVYCRDNAKLGARILHRFPFSSALKRMSCVVQHGSSVLITCKGAPEVVEDMLVQVPGWYRKTFTHLAHRGARVLALAYKHVTPGISAEKAKHLVRDQAESGLTFAGFLVFHCPLKKDSKEAIKALRESLHHVVMITGDNALTAIHTAYELNMVSKPVLLLQESLGGEESQDIELDIFDINKFDAKPPALAIDWLRDSSLSDSRLFAEYGMAMTGTALELLSKRNAALLREILPYVTVFARASPSQKELILNSYKGRGFITLMCGDGTNDVGALKQAHVGVALLDGKPEDLPKILQQMQTVAIKKRQIAMEKQRLLFEQRWGTPAKGAAEAQRTQMALQKKIEEMTMSLEQDEAPMVRLGDASVAAPFTSKISTIQAVCNLVLFLSLLPRMPLTMRTGSTRTMHPGDDDANVQDPGPQFPDFRLRALRPPSGGHPVWRLSGDCHGHAAGLVFSLPQQGTAH